MRVARLTTDAATLAGYLDGAERLMVARPDQVDDGPTGLPTSFEALRRFLLPPRCVDPATLDGERDG